MQHDGNLADFLPVQTGLDDHFAGELHAGRGQLEPFEGVLAKAAQAAMSVADGAVEEQIQDAGQHRIADVFDGARAWLPA